MSGIDAGIDPVAHVMNARTPADIFGTDLPNATHVYRQLAKLLQPDVSGDPASVAAFARLSTLWAQVHGTPVTLSSTRHSYRIGTVISQDDLVNCYRATTGEIPPSEVSVKVARVPGNNDLVTAEANALHRLSTHGDPKFTPYVPHLIESFSYREPDTGVQRTANVFGATDGFVSLSDVRDAYPDGVDPRDAVWMWRRLLVALGFTHRAGIVHGAVLPPNVLIHPGEHGLMLINWCYSAIGGARVPALVDGFASWYPGEVTAGRAPGPGTDIHLATRCMTALMGPRMPVALTNFARGCMLPGLAQRPDDAWQVLAELDERLSQMYGPRTFRPFVMPPPVAPADSE